MKTPHEAPYTLGAGEPIQFSSHDNGREITTNAEIVELIESDAFHSRSYKAKTADGTHLFIKTPRVEAMRHDEIVKRILKIEETFRREYDIRDRLEGIDYVPKILGFGTAHVGGRRIPLLVQQYIAGQGLKEYLHQRFRPTLGEFKGLRDTAEWFKIALHITKVTKRIHNQYVVHGDLGPRNLLVPQVSDKNPVPTAPDKAAPPAGKSTKRSDRGLPFIVDFGQSFLIDAVDKNPARSNNQVKAYWAPERFDTRLGPWHVAADIYSLGGILYYLATGADPDPEFKKERDEAKLKRLIHEKVRSFNGTLLRDNEGIVKIIDKCLRYWPADRYFCAENLLFDLETFDFGQRPAGADLDKRCKGVLTSLGQSQRQLAKLGNPLFQQLFLQNAEMMLTTASGMVRSHCEVAGHRDLVIDHLCRYMSILETGDAYVTVTTPAFWTQENLGVNGRFFTMNKVMARRGVKIVRVFLITQSDLSNPRIVEVLREHVRAATDLGDTEKIPRTLEDFENEQKCFYTGFRLMTEEKREAYFNENNHVAIWRKAPQNEKDESLMSVHFSFSSERKRKAQKSGGREPDADKIAKVRFWLSPDLGDEYQKLLGICRESSEISGLARKLKEPKS